MAAKITYAQTLQQQLTAFAKYKGVFADLVSAYFNRGYNTGGATPIVDADVANLGIKAADVTNGITLMQQFANFLGNVAVTQGNYQSSLDSLRSDE